MPAHKEPRVDVDSLREAIRGEYEVVAKEPGKGFHFHTGRPLSKILLYKEEWLEGIPEASIECFAGTGNPFSMGEPRPGEMVVDIGSGAGIDSFIAGKMVGPEGRVMGIDMTPAMLEKASSIGSETGFENVTFHEGLAEDLPVDDGWADVVISNGVLNLAPSKTEVLREMARVLKPGGHIQIGDILVEKEVPEEAKERIELWTG